MPNLFSSSFSSLGDIRNHLILLTLLVRKLRQDSLMSLFPTEEIHCTPPSIIIQSEYPMFLSLDIASGFPDGWKDNLHHPLFKLLCLWEAGMDDQTIEVWFGDDSHILWASRGRESRFATPFTMPFCSSGIWIPQHTTHILRYKPGWVIVKDSLVFLGLTTHPHSNEQEMSGVPSDWGRSQGWCWFHEGWKSKALIRHLLTIPHPYNVLRRQHEVVYTPTLQPHPSPQTKLATTSAAQWHFSTMPSYLILANTPGQHI